MIAVAVAQFDHQAIPRKELGAALGPFDDEDALLGVIPQPKLVEILDVLDAVEIDVEQLFAALVFVHEDKGRAVDGGGTAEAAADALGEAGLARAEVAAQEDDVAGTQDAAEALADRARFFLAAGCQFQVMLVRHEGSIRPSGDRRHRGRQGACPGRPRALLGRFESLGGNPYRWRLRIEMVGEPAKRGCGAPPDGRAHLPGTALPPAPLPLVIRHGAEGVVVLNLVDELKHGDGPPLTVPI